MMISEKNRVAIKDRFAGMEHPVVIQFFEASLSCPTCPEVKSLLTELTQLSDLLTLESFNLYAATEQATQLDIDKAPAIHVTDDSHRDTGIRFYGAPSGYEFATLLEDILMVSTQDSGLQKKTRQALQELAQPVELSVFVTPT